MVVSIVIPLYNSSEYILKTLESVYSQSYNDFECIVIDDGSRDNSVFIVEEFIKTVKDERFKIFSKKNEGVSKARNLGASKAIGEILLFLDSDDLLSKDFLKRGVECFILDSSLDLVATSYQTFGTTKKKYIPSFSNVFDLLEANKIVITTFIKRSNFYAIKGFDTNMHVGLEDWEFWIRYLYVFRKIKILKDVCFYYRLRSLSRNSSFSTEEEKEIRRYIWSKNKHIYCDFFIDPRDSIFYKSILSSKEYRLGKFILQPFRFISNKIKRL